MPCLELNSDFGPNDVKRLHQPNRRQNFRKTSVCVTELSDSSIPSKGHSFVQRPEIVNSQHGFHDENGNDNIIRDDSISNISPSDISDGLSNLHLNSNALEAEDFSPWLSLSSTTDSDPRDVAPENDMSTKEHDELFTNPLDDDLNTALHLKIIEKDESGALYIIRKATSFEYLNVCNLFNQTPLHLAVKFGLERIVRKLMTSGALVMVMDDDGNTPLHLASQSGQVTIVRHLVSHIKYEETTENRFSLLFQAIPQDLKLENRDGHNCLKLAAVNGHKEVFDILIDKYID